MLAGARVAVMKSSLGTIWLGTRPKLSRTLRSLIAEEDQSRIHTYGWIVWALGLSGYLILETSPFLLTMQALSLYLTYTYGWIAWALSLSGHLILETSLSLLAVQALSLYLTHM